MKVLNVLLVILGLIFMFFGYEIFFKKKYGLINNFYEDKNKGKFNDNYAKRVGIIEFVGGLFCIIFGFIGFSVWEIFSITFFLLCIKGIIVALIINYFASKSLE